ncbi:hypothetical protein [Maritalea myrionectae]|uniref:hypothetical protein n=1 Tax=Maritalea myrionectae TaxID=454601 RepID=UPI00048805A4|nr:hypothetical protein [Maritalea myrionectae]
MTNRREELEQIKPHKPNKSKWPKHIRTVELNETDNLGIDAKGQLYWDGELIHIRKHELGKIERIQAWIIAGGTIIFALTALGQLAQFHNIDCLLPWLEYRCSVMTSSG